MNQNELVIPISLDIAARNSLAVDELVAARRKTKAGKAQAAFVTALSGLFPAPPQFIGPDGTAVSGPRVPQDVQDHLKTAIEEILSD